ncbi:cytochrome ubiquinol oxidase subunit I [Alkalihalobacillus sp. LMS39]|uniref:cytochrome ubiquinol oxidase subunit I n=1 Tax=Alkalihalobacillus sp. LMS39 TaxID=2924032 RepID=UPI001FB3A018|nr:cytochrome ubiquinol oxidase subunit I [Alkalihalobacillus sp. LMS39]UOE92591.1 cytochrome ubiquinol oxidase subunit I [Alkalihalobacillus sp. LMS39]
MIEYDPVFYSRVLTGLTLSFHIIFATIGVGVPMMILLCEWIGIKRNDEHYLLLARRWARGFVITVAVGVVTGTAIGLQLNLLWPNFMRIAGHVIGLPLFLETFAFFIEAIFLSIYLYTWDRFKNRMKHLLLLIPVVIGSSSSAIFITMVNAFMNTPQGFSIQDGVLANVQPIAAMFTPAMPTKVAHVLSSAYLTSAFLLAMISAFAILRGKQHVYHKKALRLSMIAACVFAMATALIGDFSGKFLADYQPEKLAAAEWHFQTEKEAPLIIGGVLTEDEEIRYALKIPYALSILAHGHSKAEVLGLHEFSELERPPLFIHYLFDGMVLIGVYLLFVSALFLVVSWIPLVNEYNKLILWMIVAGGPLSMVAIELGWMFTEFGRQPWILVGYMLTSEGATASSHVDRMLILFCFLYICLSISLVAVMRAMFKQNPVEKELRERRIR